MLAATLSRIRIVDRAGRIIQNGLLLNGYAASLSGTGDYAGEERVAVDAFDIFSARYGGPAPAPETLRIPEACLVGREKPHATPRSWRLDR